MSDGMPTNWTRAKLARGEVALGVGLRISRTTDVVPAMQAAGFDWLFIDLEHGALSVATACDISVAALQSKITPIARVPTRDFSTATRILDNGAFGMVMPHVESAEQAREIVDHLRFPPLGHRSVFGGMPHFGYRSVPVREASEKINVESLVIAMLETPVAIEQAPAIAAVEGIDILFIGTNDLCAQMGLPGEFNHPSVKSAYARTIAACRQYGKWPGMGGAYEPGFMDEQITAGMRFILAGNDLSFMMASAGQKASQLRQAKLS